MGEGDDDDDDGNNRNKALLMQLVARRPSPIDPSICSSIRPRRPTVEHCPSPANLPTVQRSQRHISKLFHVVNGVGGLVRSDRLIPASPVK